MPDTDKVTQYVANWQDERNGAALYRAISETETASIMSAG